MSSAQLRVVDEAKSGRPPRPQSRGSEIGASTSLAGFFDHFETVAESEAGPERLAALAISMGMRGLLGTGDLKDEDAAKLVVRMKSERARLIESGSARRRQSMEEGDVQPLFPAPARWAWTRLGEVITVIRGASPRPKGDPRYFEKSRTPYPWVKISDFKKHGDGQTLHDTDEFLTAEGAKHSVLAKRGTLLLTNSATIGVPMFMGIDGYIHDGFLAFPHFPSEIDLRFFFLQLRFLTDHLFSEARGLAQLNLNSDIVRGSPLAVPPLAEQKRIVAKIDQLMALCNELEARQTKKRETGTRLTKSALEALTTAETPEEFNRAWTRVSDNLQLLVSQAGDVSSVKSALLELAVSGRFSSGRDAGSLSSIGDVVESMQNGLYKHAKHRSDDGVLYVRMYNIQDGRLDLADVQRLEVSETELLKYSLQPGDILVNRVNSRELVGKAALVSECSEPMVYEAMNIRLRCRPEMVAPEYLNIVLRAPSTRSRLIDDSKQAVGQASVNQDEISRVPFWLPLLPEQPKIVAVVTRLMQICDELQSRLRLCEAVATKFADAAVQAIVQ